MACIRRHGGEDMVVMRPDVFSLLLRDFDYVCAYNGDGTLDRGVGW